MIFSSTEDNVLFLYPYYSLDVKVDEMSRQVYQVFKKGWYVSQYFPGIKAHLCEALEKYFTRGEMQKLKIAITVMPSHTQGKHGEQLMMMASALVSKYDWIDASCLIQRIIEKKKSTEGGIREVNAHLQTLGLVAEPDKGVDVYIVLDDITTTGSSLEAAKQLLVANGVDANKVIKIAIAKTMYDDF